VEVILYNFIFHKF